jgi:hypothetical protein
MLINDIAYSEKIVSDNINRKMYDQELETTLTLPDSLAFLNPIIVDDLARFGTGSDGGYVLPASRLRTIDAMLSFGISNNWSLEEALSNARPDLLIHGYDHTIGKRRFGQRIALETARMMLGQSTRARLGQSIKTARDYKHFFVSPRQHFAERIFNHQENPSDATIDKVFARIAGKSHVFLKMDIEGSEYRVIRDIVRYADRIDLLAIEFHDTEPLREVFVRDMQRLLKDFEIVHLHGNNYGSVADDGLPDFLEMTLVNRRFMDPGAPRRNTLPISELDVPNNPEKPDFSLNFARGN